VLQAFSQDNSRSSATVFTDERQITIAWSYKI
jgi:hypothetical protein